MNKRLIGVFAFALVVSAVASFFVYRLVAARLAAAAHPVGSRLVVAARDLPIGALIREIDLKEVEWSAPVPAGVASKTDVVGRGVIAGIYEGEPFLESRLAPKGAGAGLAAIIPAGMRALALRVNDVTSVGGFVTPGMRVDILMLGSPPSGSAALGTQTKTLLQNIEVLSAGQQIQKDAEGKPVSVPVVNMLVNPEQAEILSLASQDARIQLVLRNPLDTKQAATTGTAMARLWGGQAAAPPPPTRALRPVVARAAPAPPPAVEKKASPPLFVMKIMHGSRTAEAKFEIPEEK